MCTSIHDRAQHPVQQSLGIPALQSPIPGCTLKTHLSVRTHHYRCFIEQREPALAFHSWKWLSTHQLLNFLLKEGEGVSGLS